MLYVFILFLSNISFLINIRGSICLTRYRNRNNLIVTPFFTDFLAISPDLFSGFDSGNL